MRKICLIVNRRKGESGERWRWRCRQANIRLWLKEKRAREGWRPRKK